MLKPLLGLTFLSLSQQALALDEDFHKSGVYGWIGRKIHLPQELHPILGILLALGILFLGGLFFRRQVNLALSHPKNPPTGIFSIFEGLIEGIHGLVKEQLPSSQVTTYFPFILSIFLFLFSNMILGLVPGFPGACTHFTTNLALGFLTFFVYQVAGIKAHGWKYSQHFLGPIWVLSPIFFVLEIISHSVRPLSLAFRVTANLFCDHLLVGIFSKIVPLVLPTLFIGFGFVVACVQSFVFTLLTTIYIGMALSSDH